MQFLRTPREQAVYALAASAQRTCDLTLYRDQPEGEISLEEFERHALDRLRVLKKLEEAKLRSKGDEVLQAEAKRLVSEHLTGNSRQDSARRDTISHHILRLAYCRTADLRNWLLAQECELFKYRFKELDPNQQVEFFKAMGLPYTPIVEEEFAEVQALLAAVAIAQGDVEARNAIQRGERRTFYRVPFALVPDLLASRKVLVRQGTAYIGRDQVYSLVIGSFRAALSRALVDLSKRWAQFVEQERSRLAPLVESMPTRSLFSADPRKTPAGQVTMSELPSLVSQGHFPPCMTVMYQRLGQDHHLKHWGRQQLQLFLKAIGLSLEQALLFWRQQFGPRTPAEKFNREYAYGIRYNYGSEGSRKDWSEWSCVKIITSDASTAAGDCCNGGCPFRQMGEEDLKKLLRRMHCSERHLPDVVEKAKGRHYQLACALAFEGIHASPCDTGINKPSEFFALSMETAQQPHQGQEKPCDHLGLALASTPEGATQRPATPLSQQGGEPHH